MTSSHHLEEKERNVPKLRFKGYNETWKEVNLKNICNDFIVPMRDKPKEFNGNVPWCRIEDIEGNYFNGTKSNQYVSQETIQNMNLKIIPTGSVICSCSASLGTYAINTCPIITNQTFIGLVCSEKISNHFLLNLMNTQTRKLKIIAGGTTIPYISREKFENYNINIPSLPEQQKIASFLILIDKKIEKQKEFVKLLKKYKRGLLSAIFSQKLRFKDFSTNWNKYTLKDIANIYDGTHQTPMYTENGIKFLSVENINNISQSKKFISLDDYKKDFKIKPEKNDILMTRIGDIGTPAIVKSDENYAYYVSLALLKLKNRNISSEFIMQNILSDFVQHELWKRTLHVAFPKKINKNEIGECSIFICNIEEQIKIAQFLFNIDVIIEKENLLLDFYNDYKKGLLQKMFI